MVQLYIYMHLLFFKWFSHLGYYRMSSRVSVVYSRSLLLTHFIYLFNLFFFHLLLTDLSQPWIYMCSPSYMSVESFLNSHHTQHFCQSPQFLWSLLLTAPHITLLYCGNLNLATHFLYYFNKNYININDSQGRIKNTSMSIFQQNSFYTCYSVLKIEI